MSPQEIVDVHEGGNTVALDNDFLEFSGEDCLNVIEESLAGRSERRWELRELHVFATSAPEVLLLGTVIGSEIVNTDSNVVVSEATYINRNM